jgi:Na+/proline symporter
MAGRLRDSITASNVSVGAAIFAFLSLGYDYKMGALIAPITWLLGFWILLKLFPMINANLQKRTLHGFLAHRYDSLGIGYLASLASIIYFLGTYGVEVLVAIKLFRILLPPQVPDVAIAVALSSIITCYTAMGGFMAATQADRFRLYGTVFGIAVAFFYAITIAWPQFSVVLPVPADLSANYWGIGSLTLLFVVSLTMINLPGQLVDMSVWQRLAACNNPGDISRGLRQSIVFIGVMWCVLIGLGILLHFFPAFTRPESGDFATPFLHYLNNRLIFALFAAGCVAALMSTADSLLLASVQTLIMDVFYSHRSPYSLFSDENSPIDATLSQSLLSTGRKWVWILGLVAPIAVYMINMAIPGILDLFFLIYCAQLTLLISVLVAILNRNPKRFKVIALSSLLLGLATSVVMFVRMLNQPSMETFLLAPILTILVSSVPWTAVLFVKKKEATNEIR